MYSSVVPVYPGGYVRGGFCVGGKVPGGGLSVSRGAG